MEKKVKFALSLPDGTEARTLEELRDHFDLKTIVEYFLDGSLLQWLEDRYYEPEIHALRALSPQHAGFQEGLVQGLGMPWLPEDEIDLMEVQRIVQKRRLLATLTQDAELVKNAASTAFTQEDLAYLLDGDHDVIYLCGASFTIPKSVRKRTYVGILGKPKIEVRADSPEELLASGIRFVNLDVPDSLMAGMGKQRVVSKSKPTVETSRAYQGSTEFNDRMTVKDREKAAELLDEVQKKLKDFKFDVDAGAKPLQTAVEQSGLRGTVLSEKA